MRELKGWRGLSWKRKLPGWTAIEYLMGFPGENKGELPRLKGEWIGGAATHLPVCDEKYTSVFRGMEVKLPLRDIGEASWER
jgi:hypothetical protein